MLLLLLLLVLVLVFGPEFEVGEARVAEDEEQNWVGDCVAG